MFGNTLWYILKSASQAYCVFNFSFWGSSIIMFMLDWYRYTEPYTTQKSDKLKTYKKCLYIAAKNALVSTVPAFLLFGLYEYHYEIRNTQDVESNGMTQSVVNALWHLGVARILSEVFFYVSHRLLHTNMLYKFVHKLHHEITSPISISALYMSFYDLYMGNILPLYLPFVIMGSTPTLVLYWIVGSTISAVVGGHGGIMLLDTSHDDHHRLFKMNYGTGLFMDWLCGTG